MAAAQLDALLHQIHRLAAPAGPAPRTDCELLDDFAAGRDEAAFAALVARHGPLVLRVCRRVLGNHHDAEDAFQATFLVLAQRARSIRKREALAGWLHGVAYRIAMKAKRGAARRRQHEARVRPPAPPAASPSWGEVQAALDEELLRLPERFRTTFVLCALEGKSGPEAAAALGCKVGTVSSRLARARRLLRQRLVRRGIDLSALLAALAAAEGAGRAALPTALAEGAVRYGLLVAAGGAAAGSIPAPVAGLAAGVTRALFLSKAKVGIAVLLAVLLAVAGAGALAVPKSEAKSQAPAPPQAHAPSRAAAAARDKGESVEVGGRVVDPDGKPVAGARVYFYTSPLLRRDPPSPLPQGTTDAEGRFRFHFSETGHRAEKDRARPVGGTLFAVAPGYGPGHLISTQVKTWADATVRLVRDMPVEGRVLDLEGRPVAGVRVRVRRFAYQWDGEDLSPWLELLRSRKEAQNRYWPGTMVEPTPLGLDRPTVTGADGKFRVTGFGRERLLILRLEGPTIATGDIYAMTHNTPTIVAPNRKGAPEFGNAVYHGARFDYVAAPSQRVVGIVRDKDTGKPLAGVTLKSYLDAALGPAESDRYLRATTGRDGRYRLLGLSRGEHDVVTVPDSDKAYLSSRKTAKAGADGAARLDFELKRGVVLRGRVTDKATGAPVAGAEVKYFAFTDNPHDREAPSFRGSSEDGARTAADGSFTTVGLPGRGLLAVKAREGEDGRYLMAVGADAIRGAERGTFPTDPHICQASLFNAVAEINPVAGAASAVQDLALDPGKTVTGTVVDPDGKPVAGVRIDGVWGLTYHSGDLPSAEFRLPAVDPRHPHPFFFHHRKRGLGADVLLTGRETAPVTVRLQKCGTLTGCVRDEDGQPRADVEVTGQILEGQLHITEGWFGFLWGTTGKDGRFRIEGVIPGIKFGLATQAGARITGRLVPEVSVKPGETKDLGDLTSKALP